MGRGEGVAVMEGYCNNGPFQFSCLKRMIIVTIIVKITNNNNNNITIII